MADQDKAWRAFASTFLVMRNVMIAALSTILSGSLSACTVGDDAPASASLPGSDAVAVGEVAGADLVVHEAIAVRVDDAAAPGVAIILTDRPGACAALKAGAALGSAHTLTLFVPDEATSSGAHVEASSACTGEPPSATFTPWDSRCNRSGAGGAATGGKVSLETLRLEAGGRTFGSFALDFGKDVLVGKFAATYCDVTSTSRDPLGEETRCQ